MFCKKAIINTCKYIIKKLSDPIDLSNSTNNKNVNPTKFDNIHNWNKTPIPRKIYFCYVGERDFPPYVLHAIEQFKCINPEFGFEILRYGYSEFFSFPGIYDNMKRYGWVGNENLDKYQLRQLVNDFMTTFVCINGGIYLSDNTFPIKPFDYNLMNQNGFCSTVYDINYNIHVDCSMVGSTPNNSMGLNHIFPPVDTHVADYGSMMLSYKHCMLKQSSFGGKFHRCQPYIIKFD